MGRRHDQEGETGTALREAYEEPLQTGDPWRVVAVVAAVVITIAAVLIANRSPDETVVAGAEPPASTEAQPLLVCIEPGPDEQVVDDVDLDGDGVHDRVTLDEEGVILACLADGGQSAMTAWPASSLDENTVQTLAKADLGGIDGLIVTLEPTPTPPARPRFHIQNYLVRLEDGELGVVGGAQNTVGGDLAGAPGLVHIATGEDFPTGPEVDQGTPGSFGVLGCRPSVLPDADFDAIRLIHYPDDRLYAETTTVAGNNLRLLDFLAPDLAPELPDSARRADLDQVLRDLGFSPGCRPVGPDE